MTRYEGLFILNAAGKEDALKETIDKISSEISSAGGKGEAVQKMDKKAFARVADRKTSAGFYVNYVFEGAPEIVAQLRHRFAGNEDIFRFLFTVAPAPVLKTEGK